MGRPSRDKGHAAERELARLLSERLGERIQRRLGAARDGGHDLEIPGFCLEVKRAEQLRLAEWWSQALGQAGDQAVPCLAYRMSRRPWRFIVPLWAVGDTDEIGPRWPLEYTAELSLEGFCLLVKEKIGHGVAEN